MSKETLPKARSLEVSDFANGPTLVLAPHADDETLACGGLIYHLTAAGQDLAVALVSDGTGSHPGSRTHSPEQRRAVREAEFGEALNVLTYGTPPPVHFLRFPDTRVPRAGTAGFTELTDGLYDLVDRYRPAVVVTPWRRDPHGDHRGTTEGILTALKRYGASVRLLEYPVWVYEIAGTGDAPTAGEVDVYAFDVADAISVKQRAIRAHRSQLDNTVFADPDGFYLTESMLAHFARPVEYYYQKK